MLYETSGRAEEILGVNIEDLDFAGRRYPVKAKGARTKARRRGQAREDYVLETVYWDAGTARTSRTCARSDSSDDGEHCGIAISLGACTGECAQVLEGGGAGGAACDRGQV